VLNSLQIIMQNQPNSAQQYAKLKHYCIYAIKWRCWRFATNFFSRLCTITKLVRLLLFRKIT